MDDGIPYLGDVTLAATRQQAKNTIDRVNYSHDDDEGDHGL